MPNCEYMVIPFIAVSPSGSNDATRAKLAAEQLATLMHQGADQGWVYYRMDHFSLYEPAGCLGSLLGRSATTRHYDAAVFRREKA